MLRELLVKISIYLRYLLEFYILETIFLSRQVLFELKTNELKIQARNFTIVYMSET